MFTHNTLVSGFIVIKDAKVDAALFEANHLIGEAEWKKGYSEDKCKQTRAIFKKHGAVFVTKLSGPLLGVSTKENKDSSGNTYQKVRITLGNDIVSLEVDSELCQRLLPKLEAVAEMGACTEITISAFPVKEERNGRQFVNHTASVKAEGKEVKGQSHFKEAAAASSAAVSAMKSAGIKSKDALEAARQAAKVQYFWELAERIAQMFPAESKEDAPSPLFVKTLKRISDVDASKLDDAQIWVDSHFTGTELALLTEAIYRRRDALEAA
ncbi:hypothetical protein HF670_11105 [Acidithiobacillus thiooxidans]|uniref:hypothetical protein n=1 Tax=Acidithiobacillus thiooxidans TaxID=930 RepID=UPI001C06C5BB|nr:hypothetical protein [Acidithiobacillus thiooxidans]MBU2840096.1 hypothetical protein [Acidithiobacillus thiooxidans]